MKHIQISEITHAQGNTVPVTALPQTARDSDWEDCLKVRRAA